MVDLNNTSNLRLQQTKQTKTQNTHSKHRCFRVLGIHQPCLVKEILFRCIIQIYQITSLINKHSVTLLKTIVNRRITWADGQDSWRYGLCLMLKGETHGSISNTNAKGRTVIIFRRYYDFGSCRWEETRTRACKISLALLKLRESHQSFH